MSNLAPKFEKIAARYVRAQKEYESAKKQLDDLKLVLKPILDEPEEVRDAIYARMKKYKLGPGISIHTGSALLSLVKGAASVTVLDINKVPEEFKSKPEPVVLKAEVLKYWRETDKKVPGVKVDIGPDILNIRI